MRDMESSADRLGQIQPSLSDKERVHHQSRAARMFCRTRETLFSTQTETEVIKPAGIVAIALIAAQVLTAGPLARNVGFYHWGGHYAASAKEGVQKIADLGGRAARLSLSPRYAVDYHQSTACSAAGSLSELIRQPDVQAALDVPGIDVYMLTVYDFTTFGDCSTQRFLQRDFYTAATTQALVQEYSDLTLYLYQAYARTHKRFIISNWESDNSIYCGGAYSYAVSQPFRAYCDRVYPQIYAGNLTPADSIQALRRWFEARQQGIVEGRARAAQIGLGGMRVYISPEVSIVRALHDRGLASVLYDIVPHVIFDYVSYSAYESINEPEPGKRLAADLDTIQDVAGSSAIILGEVGFSRSSWGAEAVTRTAEVVKAATDWGVAYTFVWNLYDSGNGGDFGVYGTDGMPTPLAAYYQQLLSAQ